MKLSQEYRETLGTIIQARLTNSIINNSLTQSEVQNLNEDETIVLILRELLTAFNRISIEFKNYVERDTRPIIIN